MKNASGWLLTRIYDDTNGQQNIKKEALVGNV
jgi:hypothetical protein